MKNDLLTIGVEALGRSKPAATGEDRALVALEAELDDLVFQLVAAEKADQLLAVSNSAGGANVNASKEVQVKRVGNLGTSLPH